MWLQTVPGRGPYTGPADVRLLRRVDAGSARLVGRPLRETCDSAVAADGRYLWITDVCTATLRRIETAMTMTAMTMMTASSLEADLAHHEKAMAVIQTVSSRGAEITSMTS